MINPILFLIITKERRKIMNKTDKKLTAKQYKDIFDMIVNGNEKITTSDKTEELVITDGERWKQCYKKGNKAREQFPKYWFVSDKGNLISVASGKAYLLKKDYSDNSGRYSYHFNVQVGETSITKNVEGHNLVRLVFGGLSYGKADELLDKDGIFAYGVNNKEKDTLQGHHIGDKSDNSPENIELLSSNAHKILHKAPKVNTDSNIKYLVELGKMASNEEPNKVSVLLTSERIDRKTLKVIEDDRYNNLYAVDSIPLSKQAIEDLKDIFSPWLNNKKDNIKKDEEKHMKYNFEIKNRQIIVNDFYVGEEPLNEYFKYHKLKNDNFSMDEVEELIDSVAYVLDEDEEYIQASDYFRIENMLEE